MTYYVIHILLRLSILNLDRIPGSVSIKPISFRSLHAKKKTPDNKYSCSVMLSVGTSLVVSGWVAGYLMEQDLENILDRSVTNI